MRRNDSGMLMQLPDGHPNHVCGEEIFLCFIAAIVIALFLGAWYERKERNERDKADRE